MAIALALAWRARERLATFHVVVLAFALPAAIAMVHIARHVHGDVDVESVYPTEGQSLLDGRYPHSEYPPGAVLLFAFETWVRDPRTVNPFVMAIASAAIAWALSSLGTPCARVVAAFVALWPANAFFWEFKFDAAPTALLVLGATAAWRRNWLVSGALLGAGAAVKWSPACAAAILVVWLIARRETWAAVRHASGFVAAFAAIVLPVLVWSPDAVWASVSRQAPRGITPESLWYLPLRALGRAHQQGAVYDAAAVPHGADTVAVALQALALLVLLVLAVARRPALRGALALALLAPAVFLVANKVFSAQYLITIAAAVSLAALLANGAALAALLLAVAAFANVLVYPVGRFVQPSSAVLFAAVLVAIVLVARSAVGGDATLEP